MMINNIATLPAGREMDARIAWEIFGRDVAPAHDSEYVGDGYATEGEPLMGLFSEPPRWRRLPPYSTDMDAAWLILHDLDAAGIPWSIQALSPDNVLTFYCRIGGDDGVQAEADTLPLAICRAALMRMDGGEP